MKQLVEYKTGKLITAQEFDQWKAQWSPDQPIPDQIHQYMNEVVLPTHAAKFDEWRNQQV